MLGKNEPEQKNSMHRTQFSHRCLIIAVVTTAIMLSWYRGNARSASKQANCVAAITKSGGWVVYSHEVSEFYRTFRPGGGGLHAFP